MKNFLTSALRTAANYLIFFAVLITALRNSPSRLAVVTASDSSHEKSLINLLESLSRLKWPNRIVVYDLGLSFSILRQISEIYPNVVVEPFAFADYPDHFAMHRNSGSYAWKPLIVKKELESESTDSILWLDAGCQLRFASWSLAKVVSKYAFFANPSSTRLGEKIHRDTLSEFFKQFPNSEDLFSSRLNHPMISASFIAIKRTSENLVLVGEWARLAMNQSLIGPPGSNKENHRFDQALLSLLVLTVFQNLPRFDHHKTWAPMSLIGIRNHQDVDLNSH